MGVNDAGDGVAINDAEDVVAMNDAGYVVAMNDAGYVVAMKPDALRVHWIQHVPFEGLGSIEAWLTGRGARVGASRMYERPALPRVQDVDLLIVMGGPMSVNDEAAFPWLREEKTFVAGAIDAGVAVLGVCLGAQLIASALGAGVRRNEHAEIGWFPIERVPGSSGVVADALPLRMDAFHWHGETFDLPPGARLVAGSEACRNQAFVIGDTVAGFQFHLETTPGSARALVENCRADLVPGRFIQQEDQILSPGDRFQRINAVMDAVLGRLAEVARRGLY